MFQHKTDLIGHFTNHKLAANLTMLLMLLAGVWGLLKLNTQFFPDFELDFISVRVVWTGAAAEDVERSITGPLEEELRNLDKLKMMTSTSARGVASITLEYREGTEMGPALDQVKEKVSQVRDLPSNAEEPEISLATRYEPVARLLVTGPSLAELRPLVRHIERELLDRGIAKINISGLPEEEIAIQVSTEVQHELELSLDQIAESIRSHSRDIPAGTVGRGEVSRQLRSLDQRRDVAGFQDLPVLSEGSGRLLTLGDIAHIERRARDGQVELFHQSRPAVELRLLRAEGSDSLQSANILQEWLAEQRLPPQIQLQIFDATWELISQRIGLLLKNGLGGLVLVLGILFLFLNGRVAFWVAVGIPVSFMATLGILYLAGGSINMISLFAMIMALGIIVDDAIVVGEDALAHYQSGEASLEAAEGGARRMFAPVLASSLTTIAAFLPLMMVGGIIGNILFDIPVVVICVIVASLVECFLVLPGHLRGAFHKLHHAKAGARRQRLDRRFEVLRDQYFRPLVSRAVDNRGVTLSLALAMLILSTGLLAGGRVAFTFFPTVESSIIVANASFVSGTSRESVADFLDRVQQALVETERELGEELVVTSVVLHGRLTSVDDRPSQSGDQFGSVMIELIQPDARDVRNETFIETLEAKIQVPSSMENFAISARRNGHPGRPINIELTGASPRELKQAAIEVVGALRSIPGVSGPEDDMPWGQEQLIYRLNARGLAIGLSIDQVGRQLRAAFDGYLVQVFHDEGDEVEVRVLLPDAERNRLQQLEQTNINVGNGQIVPLSSVVELDVRRGFEALRHTRARLAARVYADVNRQVANENDVRQQMTEGILADLKTRYGIQSSFEGKAADQKETLQDMKVGAGIAISLIYMILAWVFASWGKPIVIMATIPFAVIGAITGHFVMGMDLTVLSLFGVFGLTGIVVNDSIILMTFYDQQRSQGMAVREAVIEAACKRLRAVLLTSLTTIAGLLPLLFETSLQAQFLIPMATSISFGLGFSTVLVLFVIPSLLSLHESISARLHSRSAHHAAAAVPDPQPADS